LDEKRNSHDVVVKKLEKTVLKTVEKKKTTSSKRKNPPELPIGPLKKNIQRTEKKKKAPKNHKRKEGKKKKKKKTKRRDCLWGPESCCGEEGEAKWIRVGSFHN